MPARFANPDEASSYLNIISTGIHDFFEDLWEHTYCALVKQRDLHRVSIDQRNCLFQAALRTIDLNEDLANRLEQCRRSLHAWTVAFSAIQQTRDNIISHVSTQISFFCISVWVETWRETNAMDADRLENQYKYFTDLCEQYLSLHLANTSFQDNSIANHFENSAQLDTPLAFSLGSSVVPCLVAIVERCRNSIIRRRCIAMLRNVNRRGLFDTDYLVIFLQAIVDSEEQMARDCSPEVDLGAELQAYDIPEAARYLDAIMSPSYHASSFNFYETKSVGIVLVTRSHGVEGMELKIEEKKLQVL